MGRYPNKKLIYSSTNDLMAWQIKNLLESRGIESVVSNSNLADIVLPRMIAPIEVWVNDSDFLEAKNIISEDLEEANKNKKAWICKNCNELIEPQFAECWSCCGSDS